MKLLLLLAAVGGLLQQAPEPPARRGVNYDESQVRPYTLPDPLVSADGTPVRDAVEMSLLSCDAHGPAHLGPLHHPRG